MTTLPPAAADITQWLNILVGRTYVDVYSIIKEFQKEQQNVDCQIERILNEEPKPKSKKNTFEREKQIMSVLNDRFNHTTIDFLKGIAYNLSF
ncbi:9509_t:CDS:2 [Cetraspora pellucida]|uniref:9509_t:CDS:1 n=1 Tax=Cetraspora pellucida TaxID=1433469 RepID=A0A9N9B652_9GLOM|nr:9509_t:CDS:2 [Cetraspora pellucida]